MLKPMSPTDSVSTTQTVIMPAKRHAAVLDTDPNSGPLFDPTMPKGSIGMNNGALRVRGQRHGHISTADSGLQPTFFCEVPLRGEPGFKATKLVPIERIVPDWRLPTEVLK